jgi:hypothetical protein
MAHNRNPKIADAILDVMECEETHKIVELSAVLMKLILEEKGEVASFQRMEDEKDLLSAFLLQSSGDLDNYRNMLFEIHSDIHNPPSSATPQSQSSNYDRPSNSNAFNSTTPSKPNLSSSSNNNTNDFGYSDSDEDWRSIEDAYRANEKSPKPSDTSTASTTARNNTNAPLCNNTNAPLRNSASSTHLVSNTQLMTWLSHYISEEPSHTIEEVRGFMKERGITELNDWDEDGIPPLVRAILDGREDLVGELIDMGADVNFKTKKGTLVSACTSFFFFFYFSKYCVCCIFSYCCISVWSNF